MRYPAISRAITTTSHTTNALPCNLTRYHNYKSYNKRVTLPSHELLLLQVTQQTRYPDISLSITTTSHTTNALPCHLTSYHNYKSYNKRVTLPSHALSRLQVIQHTRYPAISRAITTTSHTTN